MELTLHLHMLADHPMLPPSHAAFLRRLRDEFQFYPRVIYDIGACVLHWTSQAKKLWPEATVYLADGFVEAEPVWKAAGYDYSTRVLSDSEKDVLFYVNPTSPGGNSYYREIGAFESKEFFPDESARLVRTTTLDAVRTTKGWPFPDLVKLDVQGAELDIYRGAKETLQRCEYLIVELQHRQYNEGAPLAPQVIEVLKQDGWELIAPFFSVTDYDADYCFRRRH